MHRDIQSYDKAGNRAKIGNRQSSCRGAGSVSLHCVTHRDLRSTRARPWKQYYRVNSRPVAERQHVLILQLTRDRMLQKMKNASATQPVPLTIDGHSALQGELSGTENNTNVVFLHTTLDDGDDFQQILAWTLKSRWQEQNQQLRELPEVFAARNRRNWDRVRGDAQVERFQELSS
jgi:hypothetical protein